ncbi:hypothetical protein CFC21_030346, partial [Triticum aestivum]
WPLAERRRTTRRAGYRTSRSPCSTRTVACKPARTPRRRTTTRRSARRRPAARRPCAHASMASTPSPAWGCCPSRTRWRRAGGSAWCCSSSSPSSAATPASSCGRAWARRRTCAATRTSARSPSGQGPLRRLGLHVRRALPRRHRLPHTGGGQPGQAVPGHQPQPRRRARPLRQAPLHRARVHLHPAHHVAEEPGRARLRVGQRRARVRRAGLLRALGRRGRRRRVSGERDHAQCQRPTYCARALHFLLLRPCHIPDIVQFHEGKGQVLQGTSHMLRRMHPQLRIHGHTGLPHVRRRRRVSGDPEPPGGQAQLQASNLHGADQPILKVRSDGDPRRDSGRREAACRQQESLNMLIRTFIVISTVIVALTVPFFGHLMALVGSLLSVMASMLLPCICYLKIFGTARCSRAEVALIVMIIVLGSLVAASGTYSSLQKIIHEF